MISLKDEKINLEAKISSNLDIGIKMDGETKILKGVKLKLDGGEVNAKVDASPLCINTGLNLGTVINRTDLPPYEGPYVATPKVQSQIFDTSSKAMKEDFTVLEIPYQEVSNPQGGETVIIAFE